MSDERTQGMSAQITNPEKAADDVSGQTGFKREYTRRELFKLVVPAKCISIQGKPGFRQDEVYDVYSVYPGMSTRSSRRRWGEVSQPDFRRRQM